MSRTPRPPKHPGVWFYDTLFPPLQIAVAEAAKQLGMPRETFSRFINGHTRVNAAMACRLAEWLRLYYPTATAESWLQRQAEYDLWQVRQKPVVGVTPFVPQRHRAVQYPLDFGPLEPMA